MAVRARGACHVSSEKGAFALTASTSRSDKDGPDVEAHARLTGAARLSVAAELVEFYQAGHSIRQLMERTGHSYGSIHRLLTIDAGIKLRPQGWWGRHHPPPPDPR